MLFLSAQVSGVMSENKRNGFHNREHGFRQAKQSFFNLKRYDVGVQLIRLYSVLCSMCLCKLSYQCRIVLQLLFPEFVLFCSCILAWCLSPMPWYRLQLLETCITLNWTNDYCRPSTSCYVMPFVLTEDHL